ncbi:hypothetical protein CW714_03000 [Methanophagales archaeon]|nr:MAG: hypothetical protein CW714_03000 [Methanophagales archaeon]
MTNKELQDALKTLLDSIQHLDDEEKAALDLPVELEEIKNTFTFEEFGFLTRDAGLVVKTKDGDKFYLTIQGW